MAASGKNVVGAGTLALDKLTVASDVTTDGIAVNTDKFTVAADTGNTLVAGTLTTTGAAAFNGGIACDTNKFTVADTSGNVATAGTLTVTGATVLNGGLTMDTNKFTVADTSGNTVIGGTLAVTGATTTTGGIVSPGGLRLTQTAPATKTAAGTAGDVAVDTSYVYVCTSTGAGGAANWKRVALSDAAWS